MAKGAITRFLRKVFRATSDGLRQAGYPDTVSGSNFEVADPPGFQPEPKRPGAG